MMPDFFQTIAGFRFCANIASIAQSLRVIAQAIKEQNEREQETGDGKHR